MDSNLLPALIVIASFKFKLIPDYRVPVFLFIIFYTDSTHFTTLTFVSYIYYK